MVVFSSFSVLSLFLVLRDDAQDEVWVLLAVLFVILEKQEPAITEFSLVVGPIILARLLPECRELNHSLGPPTSKR
jgi:hypothetical protein